MRVFIGVFVFGLICAAGGQTTYTVRLLPRPTGSLETYPIAVNNAEYVTGTVHVDAWGSRAALWDPSGAVTLFGSPLNSNDDFRYTSVDFHPLLTGNWFTNHGLGDRGFIFDSSTLAVQYFPQKLTSGLNDLGDLLLTDKSDPSRQFVQIWNQKSGYRNVPGIQPGDSHIGISINAQGDIIGQSVVSGIQRPWVRRGEITTPLPGVEESSHARCTAINAQGFIVGGGRVNGVSEAIVWRPDFTWFVLGRPLNHPGWHSLVALSLNSAHTVVGTAFTGSQETAWVWTQEEGVRRLQDLTDGSGQGWIFRYAADVNDRGQIVGDGFFNGEQQGFIMDPTTFLAPQSFSILRGSLVAGEIQDLSTSDNAKLVVRAGPVLVPTESPLQILFELRSPNDLPGEIVLKLESGANTPGLSQKIDILNHVTGSYEQVSTSTASITDSVIEITLSGDPSRFVERTTGKLKLRLSFQRTGITLIWPWAIGVDDLQLRIGV